MNDNVQHRLQERVKELTALHRTARLLQDSERPFNEIMADVVALLPPAWQHSDICEGRIRCGNQEWVTPGWQTSPFAQTECFTLRDGEEGCITVAYLEERPDADEGPFLREERDLIKSLAAMLRAVCQHQRDDTEILNSQGQLERIVRERNSSLRRLASQLSLTEERERRQIAEDLHDHLGQVLAIMKIRLQRLRGDAVFGGHGDSLGELISLSDQAIRYVRGLTFEISPPILYELGLGPVLDWYGEQIQHKHGLKVKVKDKGPRNLPDDIKVTLWKSARELLHNIIKHAEAKTVAVKVGEKDGMVVLEIEDNGHGFDLTEARRQSGDRFGLFSIEERLFQLGGRMIVDTAPGRGTRVRLEVALPKEEK